jgi:hypothetical protein
MRHSIGLAWVAGFVIASAAPLHAQTTVQRAADILKDREPAPRRPLAWSPHAWSPLAGLPSSSPSARSS